MLNVYGDRTTSSSWRRRTVWILTLSWSISRPVRLRIRSTRSGSKRITTRPTGSNWSSMHGCRAHRCSRSTPVPHRHEGRSCAHEHRSIEERLLETLGRQVGFSHQLMDAYLDWSGLSPCRFGVECILMPAPPPVQMLPMRYGTRDPKEHDNWSCRAVSMADDQPSRLLAPIRALTLVLLRQDSMHCSTQAVKSYSKGLAHAYQYDVFHIISQWLGPSPLVPPYHLF